MSVIIIGGGDGRRAIRRFELAEAQTALTGEQITAINDKIADLQKLADEYDCPCSDTEDGCQP